MEIIWAMLPVAIPLSVGLAYYRAGYTFRSKLTRAQMVESERRGL